VFAPLSFVLEFPFCLNLYGGANGAWFFVMALAISLMARFEKR
jgi:hypothetical protein